MNGGSGPATPPKLLSLPSAPDASEAPPKVPPRKESMAALVAKPELPIQLISTTNQVHKPAAVQQQIPTKLAALSKGKDRGLKGKASHKRTNSAGQLQHKSLEQFASLTVCLNERPAVSVCDAASLDVSKLVPIRVAEKGGGSLRAKSNSSPQRIQSGLCSQAFHRSRFSLRPLV